MTSKLEFYNLYFMLMIRLQRVGRKNDPSFRVVVTEKKRSAKAGRYIEMLGSYNARQKALQLNEERIKYWLGVGAKTSATLHNLLVSKNIISGPKIDPVRKKANDVSKKNTSEESQTEGLSNGVDVSAKPKKEKKPAEEKVAQEPKS